MDKYTGFHDATLYDRGGGVHTYRLPDAGDAIKIPDGLPQWYGTYESYDVNWGGNQSKLNAKWREQGKPKSDSYWAYIEIGGQIRYCVALSPLYGITGDYVDIYIKNDYGEKVYPCIIADSKDIWVDAPYNYDGRAYRTYK